MTLFFDSVLLKGSSMSQTTALIKTSQGEIMRQRKQAKNEETKTE